MSYNSFISNSWTNSIHFATFCNHHQRTQVTRSTTSSYPLTSQHASSRSQLHNRTWPQIDLWNAWVFLSCIHLSKAKSQKMPEKTIGSRCVFFVWPLYLNQGHFPYQPFWGDITWRLTCGALCLPSIPPLAPDWIQPKWRAASFGTNSLYRTKIPDGCLLGSYNFPPNLAANYVYYKLWDIQYYLTIPKFNDNEHATTTTTFTASFVVRDKHKASYWQHAKFPLGCMPHGTCRSTKPSLAKNIGKPNRSWWKGPPCEDVWTLIAKYIP